MDLYEKFKLKDQKPPCGLKISKPEFKQQYLAPLRRLSLNDQCSLLLQCKNKEISLNELKKEADMLKKLVALKNTFCKLTNAKSWEDAQAQFQSFASERELQKFISLDFSKEVPPSFVNFCRRAKSAVENEQLDIEHHVVKYQGLIACILQQKLDELSGHAITSAYSKFHGADMIFLAVTEVRIYYCSVHFNLNFTDKLQGRCGEDGLHSEGNQLHCFIIHLHCYSHVSS